ncbi:MAG: pantothenate kinase [Rectinema sp.]|nr:pantothenate kinase [Rectinema sp.]
MIIGIDIGGTTTKIVGIEHGEMAAYCSVKASDPVASAAGAIGKFLSISGKSMRDINSLAMTGVGATFIEGSVLGIDATYVEEFKAIGFGGLHLARVDQALVVSVGTGTALVHAHDREARHIGGSGVGGGTILGLGKALAGITDFESLSRAASEGDVKAVDLTIGDIASKAVGNLPIDATASNFGRMADRPRPEDYAAGIVNMVFQTVGMLAILAARSTGDANIVIVGNTMQIPMAGKVLECLYPLYGVRFIVPELAQYATALGAALSLT